MDDVESLVDDILEKCVEGYRRPKRKAVKRKPVTVVRDGFELRSPPLDDPHSPR